VRAAGGVGNFPKIDFVPAYFITVFSLFAHPLLRYALILRGFTGNIRSIATPLLRFLNFASSLDYCAHRYTSVCNGQDFFSIIRRKKKSSREIGAAMQLTRQFHLC